MRARESSARREDMLRIMRRGNIFGSREPVNKVDSVGGFFSAGNVRGQRAARAGVKEVPLTTTLDEEKENVKHAR